MIAMICHMERISPEFSINDFGFRAVLQPQQLDLEWIWIGSPTPYWRKLCRILRKGLNGSHSTYDIFRAEVIKEFSGVPGVWWNREGMYRFLLISLFCVRVPRSWINSVAGKTVRELGSNGIWNRRRKTCKNIGGVWCKEVCVLHQLICVEPLKLRWREVGCINVNESDLVGALAFMTIMEKSAPFLKKLEPTLVFR